MMRDRVKERAAHHYYPGNIGRDTISAPPQDEVKASSARLRLPKDAHQGCSWPSSRCRFT